MMIRMKHPFFSIAILGLALSWLVACGDQVSSWPSKNFESAKWMQTKEVERYIFVRDLLEKKLLMGLTRSQVVALLGPPSSEPEGANYFAYVVKADSGVLHSLDVELSAIDPRVVNAVLVRAD